MTLTRWPPVMGGLAQSRWLVLASTVSTRGFDRLTGNEVSLVFESLYRRVDDEAAANVEGADASGEGVGVRFRKRRGHRGLDVTVLLRDTPAA